jgi:hypothetical protein
MKMIYGGVPVDSMKVKHYEMNTNSATVQPSDLQAGVTCFARGQKVTGTGKAFEFAMYGTGLTNLPFIVPSTINTIQISSAVYPMRTIVPVYDTTFLDFSTPQTIAEATINGVDYPLVVSVQNNILTISCDYTIDIELFYGKDRYIS